MLFILIMIFILVIVDHIIIFAPAVALLFNLAHLNPPRPCTLILLARPPFPAFPWFPLPHWFPLPPLWRIPPLASPQPPGHKHPPDCFLNCPIIDMHSKETIHSGQLPEEGRDFYMGLL